MESLWILNLQWGQRGTENPTLWPITFNNAALQIVLQVQFNARNSGYDGRAFYVSSITKESFACTFAQQYTRYISTGY